MNCVCVCTAKCQFKCALYKVLILFSLFHVSQMSFSMPFHAHTRYEFTLEGHALHVLQFILQCMCIVLCVFVDKTFSPFSFAEMPVKWKYSNWLKFVLALLHILVSLEIPKKPWLPNQCKQNTEHRTLKIVRFRTIFKRNWFAWNILYT